MTSRHPVHPETDPLHRKTYGRSRAVRHPDFTYAAADDDELVHLTVCAAAGAPFKNAELSKIICDSVRFYATKFHYELYAYCLMPDHLHVLLSPTSCGVPIQRWLQAFKSFTGHAAVELGIKPPLWQRSAHDHVCRKEETAEVVAAYIANNPVRAGLATRWNDWPSTAVLVEL